MHIDADVAVLGAGFGGSLTALLLQRIGLNPVLIDRGDHPRFAIGESSTPIANLVLRDLCHKYDLPQLEPLTAYGSWRATYPDVVCGRKRGFSYFKQKRDQPFQTSVEHDHELLVAASADDQHSDTHWLRSDVDAFFAREVQQAGIAYFDKTHIQEIRQATDWHITAQRNATSVEINTPFIIDATGGAGVLAKFLHIENACRELQTNSYAVFGHFSGVEAWQDVLRRRGVPTVEYPFSSDNSALHHLLDQAWMWQLRFDNGITSCGMVFDGRHTDARVSVGSGIIPGKQWSTALSQSPTVAEQLIRAKIVAPEGGLRRTGRLQRLVAQAAAGNWAMLPHTAGFVDPLHSTGIAHTLCGIERLIAILAQHWRQPTLRGELEQYQQRLFAEFRFIDDLVSGCYESLANFRLFTTFSMLYFAAATTYERRRLERGDGQPSAFLCADDSHLRTITAEFTRRITQTATTSDVETFIRDVRTAIEPYNKVGLFAPDVPNMYRYTALPADD